MRSNVRPISYAKQQTLGVNVPSSITVVGTGAVGAWFALFAAIAGTRNFLLFDPAVVKNTDLALVPWDARCIGRPKTHATRDLIRRIRPGVSIKTFGTFVLGVHDKLLTGVVFNGADGNIARHLPDIDRERELQYITCCVQWALVCDLR